MPIGNATAMPAMSIAATSKMFAMLKMTPPSKCGADRMNHSACFRSAMNAAPMVARAAERECEDQRE